MEGAAGGGGLMFSAPSGICTKRLTTGMYRMTVSQTRSTQHSSHCGRELFIEICIGQYNTWRPCVHVAAPPPLSDIFQISHTIPSQGIDTNTAHTTHTQNNNCKNKRLPIPYTFCGNEITLEFHCMCVRV